MRGFIALCLVGVVCAQSGYNYHQGSVGGSGFGGGITGGSGFHKGSSSDEAPFFDVLHPNSGSSLGSSGSGGPSFGSSSFGPSSSGSFGSSGSSPSFGSSGSSPSFGGPSFNAPASQGAVEKQFITYTADEQEFHDPQATNQFANAVKQGLRVVFIKGPDNSGLENAALALAKNAASQQTAIYVLNKQTDLAALANKLNTEASNANNKPDVHFVKYRTPEDAANAQRAIQAEYDALGGKSQNIDGGVASSLNFASQAPFAPASKGTFGAASSPSYLPASIFRRYRF
ncbi:uncharacterized protein LOC142233724 [Haematobia irritans]|uniref:uncharacterized protein LOC142233724 n=1 Tax=Haematobia irritans TaxID=7368 RepID=UPI003F4FACD3